MSDERQDSPSELAETIFDLEAERQEAVSLREALSPDAAPGAGEGDLTLRQAVATGSVSTFVILALIGFVTNIERSSLGTLAPDIRDSLGISDGTMVFISSASGAFLILGALPMGWLADRYRRGRIIAIANFFFGLMVAVTGLVVNAVMLFFARLGGGIAESNSFTVHSSLTADQFPISARGRIGSTLSLIGSATGTLSPLIVGGMAVLIGGPSAWRWVFFILAIPIVVVALASFRIPEPVRGQFEKKDVLGEIIQDEDPLPISVEVAFNRLLQIRTLRSVVTAFAALGFGLFTVPILGSIFMEDEYGLDAFGRGAVTTVAGVAVMISMPFVGRYYDRLYRSDPVFAMRLVGWLILPSALLIPVQFFMPGPVLFAILGIPPAVMTYAAFSMVGPLLMAVVPYRLRGMGQALGALYIFFVGATGGALLSGMLSDMYGTRTAIIVVYVPSTIIGGLLMLRGTFSIREDLAMVAAELHEEQEDHARRSANPDEIPALQMSQVDFSYGQVQILFDVSFEVKKGEVLALLGTNGAGKSTALRIAAGLGTPSRGVVRHHGRTITYVTPETRTRLGIHMLPGGSGVFNDLSVRENLEIAAFNLRKDPDAMEAAIERALGLFGDLAQRPNEAASSLSGGQRQLLALAQVLITEPDVLIIDELSLGLAPVMVEQLVGIIEELKAQGQTIIIVEQSLNVAMVVADRAVFLEKGHVRFDGDMAELVERDDLARAVFLGEEGG